jgi:hypothetical protein
MLGELFVNAYNRFVRRDYFQEALGYECVDAGFVAGTLGPDVAAEVFGRLRKPDLWPIREHVESYSEDDLFDIIEFVYDCVSKPVEGRYHSYSDCGWHYTAFDGDAGHSEFRAEINDLLRDYSEGYELSQDGEILALGEPGLQPLLDEPLLQYDPENVESRVEAAVYRFRHRRSSLDDKRDAVKGLADVLEFLRPKLVSMLTSKDESDLFNIVNNFAIRHHNELQKTDYDKETWYTWMFYYFLATIHAVLKSIEASEEARG